MPEEKKLRIAFGVLGNITTILSSLAPIPTFYRIYKRKDTENFSVLPYATTILCNLFWAWYALPFITSQNLLLFIISAIQVALQSVYVVMFFIYAPPDKRNRTTILVLTIILLVALDVFITMALLRQNRRKTFAGIIATISSIFAYAAPLSIMGLVIRTKSVEYMPFLLSFAIFCSGFTWTVYGILGPDIFVIISDGFGFLLSTLQLVLYAIYYRSPVQQPEYGSVKNMPEEMEEDQPAGINDFQHAEGIELEKSWHQTEGQNSNQVSRPKALEFPQPVAMYDDLCLQN